MIGKITKSMFFILIISLFLTGCFNKNVENTQSQQPAISESTDNNKEDNPEVVTKVETLDTKNLYYGSIHKIENPEKLIPLTQSYEDITKIGEFASPIQSVSEDWTSPNGTIKHNYYVKIDANNATNKADHSITVNSFEGKVLSVQYSETYNKELELKNIQRREEFLKFFYGENAEEAKDFVEENIKKRLENRDDGLDLSIIGDYSVNTSVSTNSWEDGTEYISISITIARKQ